MKATVKAAIITGICTIVAGAIGGAYVQNSYINSQIANVKGNNNTVNINNVDDLINRYKELELQNSANLQNYDKVSKENEELKKQQTNSPVTQLKNLGLFVNGEEINVNKNNSYAIINGTDYFSKDFLLQLIDKNSSINIKDDNLYIGRIVAETASLFEQRVISNSGAKSEENVTDAYGNVHAKVVKFDSNAQVIFNLNQQYTFLKFKVAIHENSNINREGIITISADGKLVYTTPKLEKVSTKELITPEININNCSTLEIKCASDYDCIPLIYDATIYN